MLDKLQAPLPFFGGKSAIAPQVWEFLGDVKHYIEPFCGSAAVLLARPSHDPKRHVETINDADGYISNLWRSLQFSPDEVARWCDWPVNHVELMCRKQSLIKNEKRLVENLVADDKWHDPVMAGYYIWAASCWIGSGLTCPGQRPHLGHGGRGVHKLGQRPHLAEGEKDVREPYNTNIYSWFRTLSERLRYVRTFCGDWTRVCGGDWQGNLAPVGIFFDPPYSDVANRRKEIYDVDDLSVAHAVRDWALKRGENPNYRIVLAGYYEEHESLLSHGWRVYRWKTQGGYSNSGEGQGRLNRKREALFISPYCVQTGLF